MPHFLHQTTCSSRYRAGETVVSFVPTMAGSPSQSAMKVSAHAVSKTAEAAITAAGGSVTILEPPFKGVRPPARGSQFTNR